MNLFQLRYFVTLAKMQHYTRAAHELCITQPSLSHAISQLEAELGVALFEKSGRNTTLTSFGEEFLICANRTLATLDSGVSSLQRSERGDGCVPSVSVSFRSLPRVIWHPILSMMCVLHFIPARPAILSTVSRQGIMI